MIELTDNIVRLRAEGKSYTEIKNELGCSKGTISYHLGAGQKEKNIQRQNDRRNKVRSYLQDVKQDSVCTDCGENYPYWIMEFDHLGDKSFTIGDACREGRTLEVIKAEVAKCEIVCANCHKNRTYMRAMRDGGWSPSVSDSYAI
jgi:predicted transcriptional regulator